MKLSDSDLAEVVSTRQDSYNFRRHGRGDEQFAGQIRLATYLENLAERKLREAWGLLGGDLSPVKIESIKTKTSSGEIIREKLDEIDDFRWILRKGNSTRFLVLEGKAKFKGKDEFRVVKHRMDRYIKEKWPMFVATRIYPDIPEWKDYKPWEEQNPNIVFLFPDDLITITKCLSIFDPNGKIHEFNTDGSIKKPFGDHKYYKVNAEFVQFKIRATYMKLKKLDHFSGVLEKLWDSALTEKPWK